MDNSASYSGGLMWECYKKIHTKWLVHFWYNSVIVRYYHIWPACFPSQIPPSFGETSVFFGTSQPGSHQRSLPSLTGDMCLHHMPVPLFNDNLLVYMSPSLSPPPSSFLPMLLPSYPSYPCVSAALAWSPSILVRWFPSTAVYTGCDVYVCHSRAWISCLFSGYISIILPG